MAKHNGFHALFLLGVLVTNLIFVTIAYPQNEVHQQRQISRQQTQHSNNESRKFAVKPNATKKVALDDVEEDNSESNAIQETPTGFSWSNMLSTVMTMFFNSPGQSPFKSEDVDNTSGFGASPWANVISMGLKIINTLLGGGAPADGIDKVDNGGSPLQGILAAVLSSVLGTRDPEQVNSMAKQAGEFISIVMNLLDALKTSFSHRSLTARALGKRDSVSDAAVAVLTMVKGYARSYSNSEDKCLQRYLCEANTDCVREIGGTSIFCQLGSYATSFALDRTTDGRFDQLYDAGRKGRSGFDCKQMYLECNEV